MKRRKILTAGLASGGLLIAGGTLGFYLNRVADRSLLSLAVVKSELASLKGQNLQSSGQWAPSRVFIHCAKSIEFSMIGFPLHKSDGFKSALGSNAFAVFASLGKMTHSLDETIPGEESLELVGQKLSATDQAIDILLDRIDAFQNFQGKLKPHFAFGELTKADYELAHVMHIYNHLLEIS